MITSLGGCKGYIGDILKNGRFPIGHVLVKGGGEGSFISVIYKNLVPLSIDLSKRQNLPLRGRWQAQHLRARTCKGLPRVARDDDTPSFSSFYLEHLVLQEHSWNGENRQSLLVDVRPSRG